MLALTALLSCATLWQCASDEVYDVIYAGGRLDIINPHVHHGRYEVIFARFASNGSLLQTRNVTDNHSQMMSYIDVHPTQASIAFSAQVGPYSDVAIYEVPFEITAGHRMKQVIPETSLIKLCPSLTCASASTFSASYAPDGRLAFAFRVWDYTGQAIGNQAIGLVERNGTVRALTFAATPPFTNNTNSLETCPRFHPGDPSKLFYLRIHPDDGVSLRMYDFETSSAQEVLTPNGIYNDHPSCPEFSLGAQGMLFIDSVFQGRRALQAPRLLWPILYVPLQSGHSHPAKSSFALAEDEPHLVLATFKGSYKSVQTKEIVADPVTNSSWAERILTFTDCMPLSSKFGDVACLDKYQDLVLLHDSLVEPRWTKLKLPHTQTGWCKTNSCFRVFKRELQDREEPLVV